MQHPIRASIRTALSVALTAALSISAAAQETLTFEQALARVNEAAAKTQAYAADVKIDMNVMGMAVVYQGSVLGKGARNKVDTVGDILGMQLRLKFVLGEDGAQWRNGSRPRRWA
jgi:hypothetical protein